MSSSRSRFQCTTQVCSLCLLRRTCGAGRLGLILLGSSKPAALAFALLTICNADLDGIVQIP